MWEKGHPHTVLLKCELTVFFKGKLAIFVFKMGRWGRKKRGEERDMRRKQTRTLMTDAILST